MAGRPPLRAAAAGCRQWSRSRPAARPCRPWRSAPALPLPHRTIRCPARRRRRCPGCWCRSPNPNPWSKWSRWSCRPRPPGPAPAAARLRLRLWPAGHRPYQARLRCGLALFGSGLDQRIAIVACGIGLPARCFPARRAAAAAAALGRGAVMPLRLAGVPELGAGSGSGAPPPVVVCPESSPPPLRGGSATGCSSVGTAALFRSTAPRRGSGHRSLAALHRLRRIAGAPPVRGRRNSRIDLRLGARLGGSLARCDHRNVVVGRCRRCRQVEVLGVEEDQHADDHRQRQQCQKQDQRPAAAARLFLGIFLVIFAIGICSRRPGRRRPPDRRPPDGRSERRSAS